MAEGEKVFVVGKIAVGDMVAGNCSRLKNFAAKYNITVNCNIPGVKDPIENYSIPDTEHLYTTMHITSKNTATINMAGAFVTCPDVSADPAQHIGRRVDTIKFIQ